MMHLPKYPKFGAGDQAERVFGIADAAGVNLKAFAEKSCVITGSNGKGSTAAMLQSILMRRMSGVGLFTSPHLQRINERMRLDGADIGDGALAAHWRAIENAADAWLAAHPGAMLGGFEFLFLVAASWHQEQRASFVVWEAGIGGRHDVTRLVGAPLAAVTSLDLEHTALLGDSLEAIALDKMDVVAPGGAVIFSATCALHETAVTAHGRARGVKAFFAPAWPNAPLVGAHQRANAGVAAELASRILGSLAPDDIDSGLAGCRWPGRLEIVSRMPAVVVDVGHTPAGVAAALDGFRALKFAEPHVLIAGCSHDKPAAAMLNTLAPAFGRIIAAQAMHKGMAAQDVAALARLANPRAEIRVGGGAARALSMARQWAGPGGAIYAAGGLFIAAEVRAAQAGLDPARLAFF